LGWILEIEGHLGFEAWAAETHEGVLASGEDVEGIRKAISRREADRREEVEVEGCLEEVLVHVAGNRTFFK